MIDSLSGGELRRLWPSKLGDPVEHPHRERGFPHVRRRRSGTLPPVHCLPLRMQAVVAEDVPAQARLDGVEGAPVPGTGEWEVEVAWTALRLLAVGVWPSTLALPLRP